MRIVYLILICFGAPVAASVAWIRGLRDQARRERLADRFGRPKLQPNDARIWVHAASMGEVQAGSVLVRRLLKDFPQYEFVMTTMTATGAARVRALFPERVTHCYLPYDLPCAVRGFLDRVRPRMAVILETELWPNLLSECKDRNIGVVIASARISPRTAGRYARFRSLFRDALREVIVLAQSEPDAERFRMLGAHHVRVAGNIKFDIDIPESVRHAGSALRSVLGNRFIWVAGSTHSGEEDAALAAHRALLLKHPATLLLVPRHPQRFDEVRKLLVDGGWSFVTRSSGSPITSEVHVVLIDAMGELLACYAAADLAFVGGSLVPVGGHNVLEPAALGVATLCGPHMSSAQETVDRLLQAGGLLQVGSSDALREAVLTLANESAKRRDIAERAQSIVIASRGAAAQTLSVIDAMLANHR